MKVLELMKVHVVRVEPEATLADAAEMMDLYQLTVLPVADADGKLLGVISEADVAIEPAEAFVADAPPRLLASLERLRTQQIAEAMRRPAISADENDDVRHAAAQMQEHRLKRLPVTRGGLLVGTISRLDITLALLDGELEGRPADSG